MKYAFLTLVKELLIMARPYPLIAIILAWLLGISIGFGLGYQLYLGSVVLSLSSIIFATLSVHYINEYADWKTDALSKRTTHSGGSGVISRGIITRKLALTMAIFTSIIGLSLEVISIGLGFLRISTLPIFLIGLIGGWMYSMPPLKLAWRRLGELTNSILGGIVAPLYGYLTVSSIFNVRIMGTLLSFTILIFLNLLAVTWPDRINDDLVGKNTLANTLNKRTLRGIYATGLIAMYLGLPIITFNLYPLPVNVAGLIPLPLSLVGLITYTKKHLSSEIVYAMVVFSISQIIIWTSMGFGFI